MKTIFLDNEYKKLDRFFITHNFHNVFLVCNDSLPLLNLGGYFDELENRLGIFVEKFSDFKPNPDIESVKNGVKRFKKRNFDVIFAVGGGSAIDVAKCIRLFSQQEKAENNNTPFVVIPTTAGTGSEATCFAVVYEKGEKKSIEHASLIPEHVFFDCSTLKKLPLYQKKCTAMDTLCHAIESFWSVNATKKSQNYSKKAIKKLNKTLPIYISSTFSNKISRQMFLAANLAGKAINISKTTAAHAMSYKLTSLFAIAHGHAVALCLPSVWQKLIEKSKDDKKLRKTLLNLSKAFGCRGINEGLNRFVTLFQDLNLPTLHDNSQKNLDILTKSVNVERLKNLPIRLSLDEIRQMYLNILK